MFVDLSPEIKTFFDCFTLFMSSCNLDWNTGEIFLNSIFLIRINRSDLNVDSSSMVDGHFLKENHEFLFRCYLVFQRILVVTISYVLVRFLLLLLTVLYILVLSVMLCSFLNSLYQIFPY